MAWTAPSTAATVSTGGIGLAADWNTYVRDNTLYLYAGLTTVTQTSTAKAVNIVYQNTTAQMLIELIGVNIPYPSTATVMAGKCGSTTPPVTEVGRYGAKADNVGFEFIGQITLIVPPNFYYTASTNQGSPTIFSWVEYTFG